MNQKIVIVSYRNGGTFVYDVKSNEPITIEKLVTHFENHENWNPERDSIEIVDNWCIDLTL